MSSESPTPSLDELLGPGAWSSALDSFAEWDPRWTERRGG